jgi:signal transduction histidine kinase
VTPDFWLLRVLNLALALAVAWLGTRGRAVSLAAPAAALAALAAAEAAAVFSGRPADARLRRRAGLAFAAAEELALIWLAYWASAAAGAFDLALLIPAVLAAFEWGPLAGAAVGLIPAAAVALLISAPGPGSDYRGLIAVRTLFFALIPAAAGAAVPAARARAAADARGTLARLRAAQVGEYISLVLFQLRDYLITLTSVSEALALSVPKEDPKLGERVERLKRTVGELNGKMSRLLGSKSALTAVSPETRSAVDVAALAREVADQAARAFAPEGARAHVRVEGEAPRARADRRAIELALLAVLQNAFEAAAARGRGRVSVTVRTAGPAAEIEVLDDAGGIPETVQASVFEPLACARPGEDGMGLGLSMSRRFLERLGGGLRLKSKGGATAALLTIPLEQELPKIRNEESTWAGRRADAASGGER